MNKKYLIITGIVVLVLVLLTGLFVMWYKNYSDKRPYKVGIDSISKQKIAIIYHPYNAGIIQVADIIHSKVGGDIYKLDSKIPYPKIESKLKGVITTEQKNPEKVALNQKVDIKKYNMIFVGVPVIYNDASPVMKRFMTDNKSVFKNNQIIIPFKYYSGKDNSVLTDEFLFHNYGNAIVKNGYNTSITDKKAVDMYITLWLNDINFYKNELK